MRDEPTFVYDMYSVFLDGDLILSLATFLVNAILYWLLVSLFQLSADQEDDIVQKHRVNKMNGLKIIKLRRAFYPNSDQEALSQILTILARSKANDLSRAQFTQTIGLNRPGLTGMHKMLPPHFNEMILDVKSLPNIELNSDTMDIFQQLFPYEIIVASLGLFGGGGFGNCESVYSKLKAILVKFMGKFNSTVFADIDLPGQSKTKESKRLLRSDVWHHIDYHYSELLLILHPTNSKSPRQLFNIFILALEQVNPTVRIQMDSETLWRAVEELGCLLSVGESLEGWCQDFLRQIERYQNFENEPSESLMMEIEGSELMATRAVPQKKAEDKKTKYKDQSKAQPAKKEMVVRKYKRKNRIHRKGEGLAVLEETAMRSEVVTTNRCSSRLNTPTKTTNLHSDSTLRSELMTTNRDEQRLLTPTEMRAVLPDTTRRSEAMTTYGDEQLLHTGTAMMNVLPDTAHRSEAMPTNPEEQLFLTPTAMRNVLPDTNHRTDFETDRDKQRPTNSSSHSK